MSGDFPGSEDYPPLPEGYGGQASFPGSEDYAPGCSPVRELTLIEQINYWMARARLAEECGHANLERVAELEDDDSDWWKRGE